MNTRPHRLAPTRFQGLALLALTLLLPPSAARAGLTLEMNVIRYDHGSFSGYYFSPYLNTNSTPPNVSFGDYYIASYGSPTNGSSALYRFTTNGFNQSGGGTYGYADFDGMMHELTNGTWSISVTNSVTTNVYRFAVTANIASNSLPAVAVTFPTNGAVNITNQPQFTWQGPTNYNNLVVYYYNSSAILPVTQTSLLSSVVLYQGINNFTAHYDSNSTTDVVASVPLDNDSQPISSWVSTAHLQDYYSSQFTVGTVDVSGTSHTLVAHYTWDATNADGTASGVDSSGNGYDMNFGGSFGSQGGVHATADPAAGPRAIQFHDGDASSAGYGGWNPTPTNLLSALTGSFSVSCWIKTTQDSFGWDQAPAYYGAGIVSADNGGLDNDVIPMALTGRKIGFNTGGDVEDVTLNSTASVNDGNYHHVVVTRNQATGQKIIYIDGVLDSFSSGTTNLLNSPRLLTLGALSDASNADAAATSYSNGYDGLLDDLQIYSGVLSSDEVAQLHANPGATIANGGGSSGGHRIVAHYAFDNSGDLSLDSSANGNNLSGPSWWGPVHQFATEAEAGGGAVQFFGTSELNANDQTLTNLNAVLAGSFTFSAWVKTTVTNGADYNNAFYGAVIFWGYNDRGNTNDTIPLAITGSKVAFTTRDHLGNFETLHSLTSVNDGNYHLLTVTRDQGSGEKKIYVDGKFETSELGTTDPLNGNNYNLNIGGWAYLIDSLNTNYSSYKGLLDDVQVYTGVLADAEVAALYAQPGTTVPDVTGGSTNGLVVHHDFNEGTVLAADVSGNNNNMVHAGNFGGSGPAISSDTAAGSGSVSFDGGSYLTASANLLSTLAGEFSVSLWLKTGQSFGNQNDLAWQGAGVIAADSPNAGAKDLIPVALTGGQVAFNIGDGISDDTLNSSATVNDNTWHHVVVTRSLDTGTRQIYIDGSIDSNKGGSTARLNSPLLLTIGAKSDASIPDPASPDANGSNGYDGLLDDVQMYNRVLSSQEVAFLYRHPGAVIAGPDFATALNTTNLTWSTGGTTGWIVETTNTHDNVSAARSGAITNDTQSSYLETIVAGPGTLSYWWQAAADDFDFEMQFNIDGSYIDNIYGNTPWSQKTYAIGPGEHTVRWVALAYNSIPGTDAGYLDEVSYVATTAPIITLNPFHQTNFPGYNVALLAAATSNAAIDWRWYKLGSGSPIPNATNALYIPTNSGTAGVAGSYFAIATNAAGSATTTVATVTFQNAALPPDWSGAFRSRLYGNGVDATTSINLACLLDAAGNIYTVGALTGTNTFGSDTLISANGVEESTFLKQTATGTPIWGRCMTNNGNGHSFPRGIATAPGDGFYVSGLCFGTNWLGTNMLVDVANGSTYLARFDANGNALWVRTISGTNANYPTHHTLVSDPAGNVTLSILLSGVTSFGTTNLWAAEQQGILAQYDADGSVRWLQAPSAWPAYLTYSAGRIYGSMGGSLTNYIGGVTNVSDRRQALFCIAATNGQGLWVRGIAAGKDQGNAGGFGSDDALVAVSGTNVFVAGTSYGSNAVFGAFGVHFPAGTGQYLARYDTNGNAQLATAFGSQFTWPWAIQADAAGNVYVGADFDTYAIFGSNLIAAPFYETIQFVGTIDNRIPGQSCVAKFDRNGNPLWARLAQSPSSYLNCRDIALAADGVWSCGFFTPVGNFGTNTVYGIVTCVGTPFCTPVYHQSGYLAKITDGGAVDLSVTLLNPAVPGGSFQFGFQSLAGHTHTIQASTDLVISSWLDLTNFTGDGTLKQFTVPATDPAARYFRVRTD